MTDRTATETRTCAYCDQPIVGMARRLSPDSTELVGLENEACYKRYLEALYAATATTAGPPR